MTGGSFPRPRADMHGIEQSHLIVKHSSSKDVENRYEFISDLAAGASGCVSLVRDRANFQMLVRKTICLAAMTPKEKQDTRKEVALLSTLIHPGVVKMLEHCEDSKQQQLTLILEHMRGGTVYDLLGYRSVPPTEALVAKLMYQTLEALSYCHEHGIIHRDVKPENLTLTEKVTPWSNPDCKLIDFDTACEARPGQLLRGEYVGTPAYMAPEMHRSLPYTSKADIWSVGVTAFELLAGCMPLGGSGDDVDESVYDCMSEYETFEDAEANLGHTSWWWGWRSAEAHDFVNSLLNVDPAMRPSASKALEDPWLQRHLPKQPQFNQDIAQSLVSHAAFEQLGKDEHFNIDQIIGCEELIDVPTKRGTYWEFSI